MVELVPSLYQYERVSSAFSFLKTEGTVLFNQSWISRLVGRPCSFSTAICRLQSSIDIYLSPCSAITELFCVANCVVTACWASRSLASRSSRLRCSNSYALLVFCFPISSYVDDTSNHRVTNYVFRHEEVKATSSTSLSTSVAWRRPDFAPRGKSIWVMSPVIIARELNRYGLRNISSALPWCFNFI